MRRVLWFVLCVFTTTPCWAQGAFVQSASGEDNFVPSTTTLVIAMGSNTTAGNTLVLTDYGSSGSSVTGVTDTQSNTWHKATELVEVAGCGSRNFSIWYTENISGAADTITITWSFNSVFLEAIISEYSGLKTSSSLDQVANNSNCTGAGGDPTDSGTTGTTADANEFIIGAVGSVDYVPSSAGTGYSDLKKSTSGNSTACLESKAVSSTGTQQAAFNTGHSDERYLSGIATFKLAAAATKVVHRVIVEE